MRLTGKSDKKQNDLHEIPYLECDLRFQFRPTVRPQFNKIRGSDEGPKWVAYKVKLKFGSMDFDETFVVRILDLNPICSPNILGVNLN